ncbi:NAD(P)/FAD-dependent oxidoreductase [Bradyrhizobium prioriisuperbiae]|uniref:NAD(P)/FAD-dependent oxidoreductase n=1 Tax=Bradyrhizobium prioriisuperbiae TaxID=2854389 RepID=UPI0028EE1096|nr:FAD-dependent oxidoreductase [Bradyrhizobium prioritasuperba]
MNGLVVVGASYAGVQAALSAREAGYAEPIRLIVDETSLPYQRPPLSKGFLLGEASEQSLVLRDETFFRDKGIELLLGTSAVRVDRQERRVALADGARLDFDRLLLATGSRARRLSVPGAEREGIHYLRSLRDAQTLKAELDAAASIIIIGGGFIGLEVASTASKLGKNVTVIEAASRLLERTVSPVVSQFLLALHHQNGVDIRLSETVARLDKDGDRWTVTTGSGAALHGDIVLAGIGGLPNIELATEAGLACDNGILVDAHGATSDPLVFAAGDCTSHHNSFAGQQTRLESVQHAQDQGKAAGSAVAGKTSPYTSVPRFWSDQYAAKLQMVGLSHGRDHHVIRGEPDQSGFSVFMYRQNRLIAVDSVNRPGEQLIARKLIGAGVSPSPAQAADLSFDLKALPLPRAAEGARP